MPTTVPLASTTVIASTVRYAVRAVPDDMPDELFATTPPIVHAISLAGSGPSRRPCRSRCALTSRSVAPGTQRTRSPPSSTSTRVKRVRVSTSTPAPDAWPDRLVPPERNVTGSPRRVASRIAATTPSRSVRADHDLGPQEVVRRVARLRDPREEVRAQLEAGRLDGGHGRVRRS